MVFRGRLVRFYAFTAVQRTNKPKESYLILVHLRRRYKMKREFGTLLQFKK